INYPDVRRYRLIDVDWLVERGTHGSSSGWRLARSMSDLAMSATGHLQAFPAGQATSAPPQKADVSETICHVGFGPKSDPRHLAVDHTKLTWLGTLATTKPSWLLMWWRAGAMAQRSPSRQSLRKILPPTSRHQSVGGFYHIPFVARSLGSTYQRRHPSNCSYAWPRHSCNHFTVRSWPTHRSSLV